jgi:glycosyltransferase involved in cell wall biosynthesis
MKKARDMLTDLTVIILTFNEEENLPQALPSVVGWAKEVFVLDSGSSDRTADIVRGFDCQLFEHKFEGYSQQRNYAIDHLPSGAQWVLFLDADEWVPEDLKREISALIAGAPPENGFYLKRRVIWMGRWIRHGGYYPTWILRLFRRGTGRCEDRAVNEHIVVQGKLGYLKSDLMHENRKGVSDWIAKHNRYATLEAAELFRREGTRRRVTGRFFGTQVERKRWIRETIWNRLPPLVRPIIYFLHRYFIRLGFLDGTMGLCYHFMQGLWFETLIDLKYLEMKWSAKTSEVLAAQAACPAHGEQPGTIGLAHPTRHALEDSAAKYD